MSVPGRHRRISGRLPNTMTLRVPSRELNAIMNNWRRDDPDTDHDTFEWWAIEKLVYDVAPLREDRKQAAAFLRDKLLSAIEKWEQSKELTGDAIGYLKQYVQHLCDGDIVRGEHMEEGRTT